MPNRASYRRRIPRILRTPKPRPVILCAAPGCGRPAAYHHPDACRACYQRERHAGTRPERGGASGPEHGAWRGDAIGYGAAHDRIVWTRGPARQYACAKCAEDAHTITQAAQWSLQPDAASTQVGDNGCRYSTRPEDYAPLCASCHARLDDLARRARSNLATPPGDLLPGLELVPVVPPRAYRGPLLRWAEVAPSPEVGPAPEPLL